MTALNAEELHYTMGRPAAGPIEAAGRELIDAGLLRGGSAFTPGHAVWTSESLAELKAAYVDQPGISGASFEDKLSKQLAGATDAAIQLFAEIFYLKTSWEVAAGTKIGVARVGSLQVTVRPKIPIDRLVFMMGYAQAPKFWRQHDVLLAPERDLPDALAESFRRLATKALEQGLLHGYREVNETLPVVRGRIRVGDQLTRRPGLGIPLEVRYDEFTADIAENRVLLAATTRLLRMPTVNRVVRQSLQRLRLQLADVTPVVRGETSCGC